MKNWIIIFFMICCQLSYSQSANLLNKNWSYKKVTLICKNDTLTIFHKDSTKNIWYLGRVSLTFKADNTYSGIDVEGNSQTGTWSMPTTQTFIVDKDTTQFDQLTSTTLKVSGIAQYHDVGVDITGTLLTEFYTTPPVISTCESRQSGDWRNPVVWSCGREPTSADVVVINPGHTITITNSNAQAQRIIHNGGKLWFTSTNSKLFVNGDR